MKKIIALLLVAGLFVSLVACATDDATPASPAAPDTAPDAAPDTASDPAPVVPDADGKDPSQMTFAYIIPALDANWYIEIVDGFKMAAEEVGAEVLVLVSDYDTEREIAHIELCVTEQVDGLAMFSFNENGAGIAAHRMQEAGIPLVVPDSVGQALTFGADLVAALDFDWYEMGVMYADWMAANTTGDFVIITGNFEHFPCIFVNQGMEERSEELGVNSLLDIRTAEYNPDKAAAAMEDLLAGGLEFETIFVMQEEMAAAVVRVLDARGVLNNPYRVITQNGQEMGIEMVKNGQIAMTISSSPGLSGYINFRMLLSYVAGQIDWKNEQKMIPIAAVTYDDAQNPDPRIVIPWSRNPIFKELTADFFPELMWY